MLGFDAEERGIQNLPHRYAEKVMWGSRFPNQDPTSAWDAIETLSRARVSEATLGQMLGGNAGEQFGVTLKQAVPQ